MFFNTMNDYKISLESIIQQHGTGILEKLKIEIQSNLNGSNRDHGNSFET